MGSPVRGDAKSACAALVGPSTQGHLALRGEPARSGAPSRHGFQRLPVGDQLVHGGPRRVRSSGVRAVRGRTASRRSRTGSPGAAGWPPRARAGRSAALTASSSGAVPKGMGCCTRSTAASGFFSPLMRPCGMATAWPSPVEPRRSRANRLSVDGAARNGVLVLEQAARPARRHASCWSHPRSPARCWREGSRRDGSSDHVPNAADCRPIRRSEGVTESEGHHSPGSLRLQHSPT